LFGTSKGTNWPSFSRTQDWNLRYFLASVALKGTSMTKVRYLVRWPGSLDLGLKEADRVAEG
jgi:hypothetical protein